MAFHSKKRFESWLPACFDGEFAWDFLQPCFMNTKIMPSDFDAVIERHGHFLIFETKIPGKAIDTGQSIALTNMWRQSANNSIILLAGKTPETIKGASFYWGWETQKTDNVGDREIHQMTPYDIQFQVRKWFCKASGQPIPTREDWDRQLWLWDYERKSAEIEKQENGRGR